MILFINFCIIAIMFVLQAYALRDLRKDYDGLREDYNNLRAGHNALKTASRANEIDLAERVDKLLAGFIELEEDVRTLTPEAILYALKTKELFLDRANTRIDNGIATARNLGETAGDNAARNLIRKCLEHAAAGKGPPLSILPDGGAMILSAKAYELHKAKAEAKENNGG